MLLGALALGTLNLGGDLRQEDAFTDRPDSVSAMRTLAEEYPERSAQPITVIAPAGDADEVVERVRGTEGVAEAAAGRADGTWAEITVFATAPPESAGETRTIEALRDTLDGTGAHVGGPSAEHLDLARSEARDRAVIVPLVLAAVFLILVVLLRSLVAPLLLLGAVVAVWGAALGIGGLVFGPLLGFMRHRPGDRAAVVRVPGGPRRRLRHLPHAPHAGGVPERRRTRGGRPHRAAHHGRRHRLRGRRARRDVRRAHHPPLVAMVELGFVIAVGVLLDTFLVRTYLVTTASVLLGRRMWWPGALSRTPEPEHRERQPEPV